MHRLSATTVEIVSERFLFRELTEEGVTERYLSWLGGAEAKKFITFAAKTKSLSDLRQYVRDRIGRDDILFLGIFEKTTGLHIGNIKYEPVNSDLGYAIVGLLIGDSNYHGKSVAAEVLVASAQWLKAHRNINQIVLGVSKDNYRAIRPGYGLLPKYLDQVLNRTVKQDVKRGTALTWDIVL